MKVNKRIVLKKLIEMQLKKDYQVVILDYDSFRDFCSFNKQDYPKYIMHRDLILSERFVIYRKKHIFVDLVNNVIYSTNEHLNSIEKSI